MKLNYIGPKSEIISNLKMEGFRLLEDYGLALNEKDYNNFENKIDRSGNSEQLKNLISEIEDKINEENEEQRRLEQEDNREEEYLSGWWRVGRL